MKNMKKDNGRRTHAGCVQDGGRQTDRKRRILVALTLAAIGAPAAAQEATDPRVMPRVDVIGERENLASSTMRPSSPMGPGSCAVPWRSSRTWRIRS